MGYAKMLESRRNRNERLRREGRWGVFNERRLELKAQGKSVKEIAQTLAEEYAPIQADEAGPGVEGGSSDSTIPQRREAIERCKAVLEAVPVKKRATFAANVEWVADHLKSYGEFVLDQVPSRNALTLLMWCLSSAMQEAEFWTKLWPRAMAAKKTDETDRKFSDDGRKITGLIDQILKAHEESVLQARTEGISGELALPEEADPDGIEFAGDSPRAVDHVQA